MLAQHKNGRYTVKLTGAIYKSRSLANATAPACRRDVGPVNNAISIAGHHRDVGVSVQDVRTSQAR